MRLVLLLGSLFGTIGLGLGLGWTGPMVQAADYDYYVKAGEDGDGSANDPFGSIDDAIDEIGSDKGKRVYVHAGSYSASVTIPKGTVIVGADAKEVSITGLLTLSDDVELEKLGFSGGGSLLVAKNSKVTLEKLRFKDIVGTAIKSDPGSAKVVIRDSLIEKARKGMYLQAGTTLEATELEVINNLEEGIDIRENVNGSITKSVFRDNKESGVEIVLGSSNFTITNNTFSGNGASGVAAQFYISAKKLGSVKITGNTFSKNDWGVDCKAPQGKMESKFYFLNSLTIENNIYKDNRDGEIASRCKIMTDEERLAYEAEEAKRKQAEEDRVAALSLTEAALADRMAKSVAERRAYEESETAREKATLEPSLAELATMLDRLETESESWSDRSAFACFVFGPDAATRDWLLRSHEGLQLVSDRFNSELVRLRFETNQTQVRQLVGDTRERLEALRPVLAEPACSFSLFGWAARLIEAVGDPKPLLVDALLDRPLVPAVADAKFFLLGELAYYPKVREQAIRQGDGFLLGAARDQLRSYTGVGAFLPLPITSELDPLPPVTATAPLSFPFRFANLFASAHITHMALAANRLYTGNLDAYPKTTTQLTFAGIETLGESETFGPELVMLGDRTIRLYTYRESLPATLEKLSIALKEGAEPSIVLIAWDEARRTPDADREQLLDTLVAAGADLVVGHDLKLGKIGRIVDGTSVYRSLGSPWRNFELGNPAGQEAVGLELTVVGDRLSVSEKRLTFTSAEGLKIHD